MPRLGEDGIDGGKSVWACVWDLVSKCGLKMNLTEY